jgi:hypothetical protein
MKYKNIIKLRLPEIQLIVVLPTQLKFSIVKDHDEPTILLFETLFCTLECFNMGTELPTKVMLGQKLVLMQMIFLNNVRKVGRLVLSRTSCSCICAQEEFHGTVLILLAARMKRCGCGGTTAVIFPASFYHKSGFRRKCSLNASFIFASLVCLTYRTKNLCC